MRGDDENSIKVSDAELKLLRDIEAAGDAGLYCSRARLRTAHRLRDRKRAVAASSPEPWGQGAQYKLTDRGRSILNFHRPKPAPKTDGLGNPIDDDLLYYVQDARLIVGNCASWWCPDGKGYTCELDKAGWYKGSEVMGMRDTDMPWPIDQIEAAVVRHVRVEGLARLREGKGS